MLPTPSPSPSASPPPLIETVRVSTGAPETLHRLPFASAYLDGMRIRLAPAVSGDELMRQLPGSDRDRSNSAFTNYGQARVSFGGAGNDRGLVIVDGIPAQDGFGGQIDWAAYPAADIARAELLRGPGSALYGAGAIGGVLSLQTYSWTDGFRAPGAISASGGSHDASVASARGGGAASDRLEVSATAAQANLSYSDLPPGFQTPVDVAAQSAQTMAAAGVQYRSSPSTTIAYGLRGAWDAQQEGRPNYDFNRRLTEQRLAGTHRARTGTVAFAAYARDAEVTNVADRSSAPGSLLYTQDVPTHESGATLEWNVAEERSTFNARISGRFIDGASDQYNASGTLTASGHGKQRIADAAVQNVWQFASGEAVAGVDFTAVSLPEGGITAPSATMSLPPNTARVISPRVAARFDLSPHLALRASAGSGLRAPYLNELVRGYVIGPVSYLPNPLLIPERSRSIIGGVDWQRGGSEISLDVTNTAVHDAIAFETVDATHEQRSNIDRTQTTGVTLDARRRIDGCSLVELWGTAQHATVVSGPPADTGKALPYVPALSAGLSYETVRGRAVLGTNVSYLGVTYADDVNAQPLGTAVVVGAHAGLLLSTGVEAFVSAANATGARYLSSVDRYAPPAVLTIGLRIGDAAPADRRCGS